MKDNMNECVRKKKRRDWEIRRKQCMSDKVITQGISELDK